MTLYELDNLIKNLSLSNAQINKAMKRAIFTVLRGSKTLMARDIAQETKVKVAVLRNRMKIFDREKDIAKKLSMITFAVPAILSGRYRKTKDGYMVGSQHVKGAFLQNYRGRDIIFRRKGRSRYPIEKVRVPIHAAARQALDVVEFHLEDRLLKAMGREVQITGGIIEF